jgi:hypothetical protein
VNTIADQLLTRRIYDKPDSIWKGFVVFGAFAFGSASIGPACELLLRLPAPKLDLILKDERMVKQDAAAKLADYVSRLNDRIIDCEVRRVLGMEAA